MIKEVSNVSFVGSDKFLAALANDLQQHQGLEAEIKYQMAVLPNGLIQHSALIIYR